jgi:hypothetical protein
MDLTQKVVQVIEDWAGTRVDTTTAALVELYRQGGNTARHETAIEILVRSIAAAFPERRIQVSCSDFLGESPSIHTVNDLVAAIGLSGNDDTDYRRRRTT